MQVGLVIDTLPQGCFRLVVWVFTTDRQRRRLIDDIPLFLDFIDPLLWTLFNLLQTHVLSYPDGFAFACVRASRG